MNSAVVLFLKSVDLANDLVQSGVIINDQLTLVLPLSTPSKKVILSNVPPFIKDELMARELSRYGKVVSPICKIPLGRKNPLISHLVSFRRLVFMVLKDGEDLDLVLKFSVDGFEYAVYISSETAMKCFWCGQVGHLVRTCPVKEDGNADAPVRAEPEQPGPVAAGPVVVVPPAAAVHPAAADPPANLEPEGGDLVSEPSEIHQQTVSFFSKLFESEWASCRDLEERFFTLQARITQQSATLHDAELSLGELHEALQGDLTVLKNWRPVALLCTDCKLLPKVLASRLGKVMEQVVHRDQTYCVPDQTSRVQTTRSQNEPVQTSTAQTGGTVNAPLLHGSVFHGTVNINFGADTKHRGGERIEEITGKSTAASSTASQTRDSVRPLTAEDQQHCIQLRSTLWQLYESVLIGNSQTGRAKFLEDIYTDLIVVQNQSGGVINEHEVMQMEMSSSRPAGDEISLKCSDLFKVQPGTKKRNRKVLTMGIAGVGKTVSVHKFILDWVKGEENQDISFIFPLPFRELNLKKDKEFSLIDLLNHCFFSSKTGLKFLPEDDGKVLFIFDGLDECCFPLCFEDGEEVKDISEKTSVGSLVTNLINRNLLPFALIWITCRPAAAPLIPRDYVNLVTEVRGFSDEQKEEYFRKYCNQDMAVKIVSHIKKSRSLYIMCQIPVFCWISATVLQPLMVQESNQEIPTTLTGMYISFLLQQKNLMKKKYSEKTTTVDAECIILKLGELAFCNLESGSLNFYEDDLKKCGIDVRDGTVFSGVCTQIFSQQEGVSERNIFSFVHLSVQESLAALYVHHSHYNKKMNAFKKERFLNKLGWMNKRITDLHKCAVKRALQSENGHLDLFLRFLLGLSLEDSQHVITELLPNLKIRAESVRDTADYIKMKLNEEISSDRSLNLLHCLSELKDNSLTTEIQKYLNSGDLSTQKLSSTQWSALVFVLLMSEETREKFELKKYKPSEEGLTRLLPVVKNTRRAL
ncbi:hypothetical protein SRHO_G00189390 [Serrasalmus rhombeus]